MRLSRRAWVAAALAAPLSRGQSRPLVIDANCRAGLGEAMTAPGTTRASVEVTLRHMQEAAIDRTILSAVTNSGYEKPNQAIAEICKRNPGKFIGFARHDGERGKGGIGALLRREVETLGLRGLRVTRQPLRDLLDAAAELRIPVLYESEELSNLHLIAAEYPKLPFILTSLGTGGREWAAHYEAIAIARRYPNVYLTTSALAGYKYFEIAVRELGAEKLIFASDGPERDSRVELYRVRLLKLSPADEAKVLGGNIQRLLPGGTL